jgi:thiamine pyrophosphokinase
MHIVIVAGGTAANPDAWEPWLAQADQLIAADGGAAYALAAGHVPDIVVGDLDSLNPQDRHHLEARGVRFEVHPRAKDETDLELALGCAVAQEAGEITILGALGGRLDHTLGNLLLLTDARWAGARLRLVGEGVLVLAVRSGGEARIEGEPGDLVSLLPLGGDAPGVHTEGLAWQLDGDTLVFGHTRGVSNQLTAPVARVWLEEKGSVVLVVHVKR